MARGGPRAPRLPQLPQLTRQAGGVPGLRRTNIPIIARGPRALQSSLELTRGLPQVAPPIAAWFRKQFPAASLPEWNAIWALLQLGKRWDIDFRYQGNFSGGHQRLGGIVVDILMQDGSNIAFDVQGLHWHYEQGSGKQAIDQSQRQRLALYGVTLIFLDEDHLLRDPLYYVRDGLQRIDHSRGFRWR